MDRNDEFEIIQLIDKVIGRHASHIQETYNEGLPMDERMHISTARDKAMEELEELFVEQLRKVPR